VHYAGPGMLIDAVNSVDGASLLAFDLIWTGLSVAGQIALGVGVALLLERRGVRFKGWWRALFIAPWAIPEFVGAVAWRNLADPQHGWIALTTGASIDWTTNAVGALIVALVVATWCGWPLVFLAATAGLNAIPPEVQEAAAIDGAGTWHRLRHVTWPLLAPLLAPAILVRVIFAFNQFYVFYVLASSSQNGLPISTLALTSFYVFDPTSGAGEFALSAVINILAVVVLIALVLRLHGWQRRGEAAYA
jgi:arabinogalactan oligomer/maltooligosaccharide transport system permease protein